MHQAFLYTEIENIKNLYLLLNHTQDVYIETKTQKSHQVFVNTEIGTRNILLDGRKLKWLSKLFSVKGSQV